MIEVRRYVQLVRRQRALLPSWLDIGRLCELSTPIVRVDNLEPGEREILALGGVAFELLIVDGALGIVPTASPTILRFEPWVFDVFAEHNLRHFLDERHSLVFRRELVGLPVDDHRPKTVGAP